MMKIIKVYYINMNIIINIMRIVKMELYLIIPQLVDVNVIMRNAHLVQKKL